MTTPVAAAARSGGRTQQGRTPAPGQSMPGSFGPAAGSPPGRPARSGGRTQQGSRPARSGGRTQQGTQGGRQVRPGPKPKAPRKTTARDVARHARTVQRNASGPEFTGYQGVIIAEFIAAELLVAATPIATRKNQPGLSPYAPRDMTKLLAIGLTYFLLELLAVGGRGAGRFGAWFGGLILLVVGMNEAANVAKVLDIFGAGQPGEGEAAGPPVLGQQVTTGAPGAPQTSQAT